MSSEAGPAPCVLASLVDMFPALGPAVVGDVLEQCGNNQVGAGCVPPLAAALKRSLRPLCRAVACPTSPRPCLTSCAECGPGAAAADDRRRQGRGTRAHRAGATAHAPSYHGHPAPRLQPAHRARPPIRESEPPSQRTGQRGVRPRGRRPAGAPRWCRACAAGGCLLLVSVGAALRPPCCRAPVRQLCAPAMPRCAGLCGVE